MEEFKLDIKDGIVSDIESVRTVSGEFEDVNGELMQKVESINGKLYIPKKVRGISSDAFMFVDAEEIEVDPENPNFYSKDNCLFTKEGKLVFTCKNSVIPRDGSIKVIGYTAFQVREEVPEIDFASFKVPDGVTELEYRAFAVTCDYSVHITIPESVTELALMSLMINAKGNRITIDVLGDPKIEVGVFGTKEESNDSPIDLYRSLPDIIYARSDLITVHCNPGTMMEGYCKKYGISCETF